MSLRRLLPVIPLAVVMAFAIANLGLAGPDGAGQEVMPRQAGVSLSVPSCTTVSAGDTFTVSVFVSHLEDLLAWEVYFAFDRDILEVTGRDVRLLLAENDGSNVLDFSDPVPNVKGLYGLRAADLGSAGSAESGSGLLATVTLAAKKRGVSPATIARLDFSGDGNADLGPVLTRLGGSHIGDVDGDPGGIFDGAVISGQVAVDSPCLTPVPESSPQVPGATPKPGATAGPGTPPADGSPEPDATNGPGNGNPGEISPTELAATPGGPATATAEATLTPAALVRTNHPSSSDGLPAWVIAAVLTVVGMGFVTTLAIIRASRRRPA